MRRRDTLRRSALTAAITVILLFATVATASAVDPGRNGWFWPLGHDHTSSGGSWLQYRSKSYSAGEAWHLAFDDLGKWKDPVYALADGVVVSARSDVGGYGPGASKGGAIIVQYRAADGTDFKALYGHVQDLRVHTGQTVHAGDILAVLNDYSPPHVHFGIHLGTGDPVAKSSETSHAWSVSIWMGHTYDSTRTSLGTMVPITYGWTDPVAFLGSHAPSAPPVAVLTSPIAPRRTMRAGVRFNAVGQLSPKHPVGAKTVTVEAWRLAGTKWVLAWRSLAVNSNYGTRTRYTTSIRLRLRGSYKLRAYVPGDSAHQEAWSKWWAMMIS